MVEVLEDEVTMKRQYYFRLLLSLAAAALFLAASMGTAAAAFDPAVAFEKKCSGCHTIGGGVLKGPDLKGVSERRPLDWIVKFVISSADVIASGDPQAVKIYNEFEQKDMPDQRLSPEEVKALVRFIESGGAAGATAKLTIKSALQATPEDIAAGRDIFLGMKRLENGGPSCVSCHSVGTHGPLGGGTLGKNLTGVYAQYKDQGLTIALNKLAFPVMEGVFADKPLTEDETFRLKAFFYDAEKEFPAARDPAVKTVEKRFLFLGVGGTVLALGLIDFTWRRRRKSSVRRSEGGIR
jgi:mono/diheme cytochrome c family protein